MWEASPHRCCFRSWWCFRNCQVRRPLAKDLEWSAAAGVSVCKCSSLESAGCDLAKLISPQLGAPACRGDGLFNDDLSCKFASGLVGLYLWVAPAFFWFEWRSVCIAVFFRCVSTLWQMTVWQLHHIRPRSFLQKGSNCGFSFQLYIFEGLLLLSPVPERTLSCDLARS